MAGLHSLRNGFRRAEFMAPDGRIWRTSLYGHPAREGTAMAKSQKKSNREVRKPKAEKVKTIAANASEKNKPVAMVNLKN